MIEKLTDEERESLLLDSNESSLVKRALRIIDAQATVIERLLAKHEECNDCERIGELQTQLERFMSAVEAVADRDDCPSSINYALSDACKLAPSARVWNAINRRWVHLSGRLGAAIEAELANEPQTGQPNRPGK